MATELISDRGRGPEIAGTRITVYNLMDHFLDPSVTEAQICVIYDLTPEEVAAARAYVLRHPETVLAEYVKIEERLAVGNPPELVEQAKRTHERFVSFKQWLAEREPNGRREDSTSPADKGSSASFPTFREWLRERMSEQP